jgi:hypothetical protein
MTAADAASGRETIALSPIDFILKGRPAIREGSMPPAPVKPAVPAVDLSLTSMPGPGPEHVRHADKPDERDGYALAATGELARSLMDDGGDKDA